MGNPPTIDYDALAAQARSGGTTTSPKKPSVKRYDKPSAAVDYDALAQQVRAGSHASADASADLVSNPKGEGLYEMHSPDGDVKRIPFSKVPDAMKSGYKATQADRERYAADYDEWTLQNRSKSYNREQQYKPVEPGQTPTFEKPGMAEHLSDIPEAVGKPATGATPEMWSDIEQWVSGKTAMEKGHAIKNFFKGAGAMAAGIPEFPVDASAAFIDSVSGDPKVAADGIARLEHFIPPQQAIDTVQNFKAQWKEDPKGALSYSLGQLATVWAAHKGGKAATETVPKLVEKTTEGIRKSAQSFVGAGDKAVKAAVGDAAEKAGLEAKATEEKNRAALKKYEDDLAEANRNNLKAHLKWKQSVAETQKANAVAQKAVDEANRAVQNAHTAAVGEASRQNLKNHIQNLVDRAETAKKNAAAVKAVEEHNRAELAKHKAAVEDAERKNTAAQFKYQSEKAEAENLNAAARAIPDARAGLEKSIEDESKDLRAEIETSRKEALEEGNKKYNTVNEKLNPLPADMEKFQDAYLDAMGKIKGSEVNPPILKAIGERIKNGDALTYEDLQGFYSELGNEISKGSLHGDIYTAYDDMHEAIGDDMQRIADSQDAGQELKDARNYWRRMKQAFGKPYNPTDAASKSLEHTSPEWAAKEAAANQLRLLGSFNETIPEVAGRIESAREKLSDLPGKGKRPTAKIPEPPEEVTVEPPKIQKPPTPEEHPKPPEEVTVEPPKLSPPAEQKEPSAYPEEQTVEPPKTNAIEVPEVNTRELRKELLSKWGTGESKFGRYQVARFMAGGLSALIDATLEHRAGTGAGFAGMLGYIAGPAIIAKIVEMPAMQEWLTRPPAGELETLQKLPYADRIKIMDGLKQAIPAARAKGVKVSPLVVAAVAAGTRPQKQETQK